MDKKSNEELKKEENKYKCVKCNRRLVGRATNTYVYFFDITINARHSEIEINSGERKTKGFICGACITKIVLKSLEKKKRDKSDCSMLPQIGAPEEWQIDDIGCERGSENN